MKNHTLLSVGDSTFLICNVEVCFWGKGEKGKRFVVLDNKITEKEGD
jgi:hypothetical protein